MDYTETSTRALHSPTTECRKQNNEPLHILYSSLNIKMINSRRIRWVRHVACIKELKNTYKFYSEIPKGRGNFRDLGILWLLNKQDGSMWTRSFGSE
jgi:hypothetical protein